MVNENQLKGLSTEAKGKIQSGIAEVTGNPKTAAKGAANQVAGKAQQAVGDVQHAVNKVTK